MTKNASDLVTGPSNATGQPPVMDKPAGRPGQKTGGTHTPDENAHQMLGAPDLTMKAAGRLTGLPGFNALGPLAKPPDQGAISQAVEALAGRKIIHLPFEIAGNMRRITGFLRGHGVDATSANYYDNWLRYKCDINLGLSNLPAEQQAQKLAGFANELLSKYDIFHFHFGHSIFPDLRDLDALRQKGKKIVFSFWGSDMRSPEWLLYNFAKFLGHNPPKPYPFTLDQYLKIKHICRYAHVTLASPFIPNWIYIPGLIDVSEWTLADKAAVLKKVDFQKDSRKTYFLHAPSSEWKKGSVIVKQVLEQCKREGMPIETIYLNQLPAEEAKKYYAQADFAIDQLTSGTFGLFGAEMMSWEIPILTYKDSWWDCLRGVSPAVGLTLANFKEQIAHCIRLKQSGELADLGARSRQWVKKNVDMPIWLPHHLVIYALLASDLAVPHYINQTWLAFEGLLQKGHKSDFFRYMNEQNVFAQMSVSYTKYDKRLYN